MNDPIDRQARERAEGWLRELEETTARAQSLLTMLGGFVDGEPLASAIVGAAGVSAGEVRQRIPALRKEIRNLDPEYAQAA